MRSKPSWLELLGCTLLVQYLFSAVLPAALLLQVVLTDLPHILHLTRENLALNFPLTSAAAASTGNSSSTSSRSGTFGSRSNAAQQISQAQQSAAGLAELEGAAKSSCVSPQTRNLHQQQQEQQQSPAAALSASAAFAAAFCGPAAAEAAAEPQPAVQQQHQQLDWPVFAAGPLVVEHSWGEPAEQLQQRVAAAAAARLQATASQCVERQLQQEQQGLHQQQQQQQQEGAQEQGSVLLAGPSKAYDFVVGADLLYDPTCHQALLSSLQQLCAPHTQVIQAYVCQLPCALRS